VNRRLRKQLDALEGEFRKLVPDEPKPDPIMDAYARVVEALTSQRPEMEWRFEEHGLAPGKTDITSVSAECFPATK
jgi:hypothetical protein